MNRQISNALDSLKSEVEKKEKRTIFSFHEFLEVVRENPRIVLRSIFQLFHDMAKSYIGEGVDENPDDPESIGFVRYDCSKLLVDGADNPFFADRLFANRFVRHVESLKQGSQQNRIYIYEGPHGCGKSTFLNNLLKKFEEYTGTKEGQSFEIVWMIDENLDQSVAKKNGCNKGNHKKIEVYCPSHDHPILLIPKNYRVEFLDKLLLDNEIKYRISDDKEYEWIFKEEVCTICKSLFWVLFDKLGSLEKVLNMVYVRPYNFDRRLGEGISVFNPGDKQTQAIVRTDKQIQEKLNSVLGAGNPVKYVFSGNAKTNNGIYALMDIKSNNNERLLELHNVITEGVHKVADIEERVNSLFVALMNPEDKKVIGEKGVESFQERTQYIKVPYVMEPQTELKIYRSKFGKHIDEHFLPRILENFARVIISTRMNASSQALSEWIKDLRKYKSYCDEAGLLLRMEIYSGIIPSWLSDEDRGNFTAKHRRRVVAEGEKEGDKGFSGRDSLRMFGEFLTSRLTAKPDDLIDMDAICDYFKRKIDEKIRDQMIPKGFLGSLLDWYDYTVLNEIKEALYFYNKKQISEDILNFLFAVNHDPGTVVKCVYTGKQFEVTKDFFKLVGGFITGKQMDDYLAINYAQKIQQKYVEMLTQELQGPDKKDIKETDLYKELFNSYVQNLKEKVLQPFVKNENFREAVKVFGTEKFKTFDTRLKDHVAYMLKNLVKKFGYTEKGAKEICLYLIDNNLVEKFS